MKISIRVTQDQSEAMLRLKDGARKLLPALVKAWGSAGNEVLGRAVKGRFTGKGPFPVAEHRLGVVTNRLRRSMRATAPQLDAATGTVSMSMGSNVSYYGPHEFGFRGRVQVRGHVRRAVRTNIRRDFKSEYSSFRGKLTKASSRSLKENYQRGRSNYSNVRPHTRRVNVPARRPLATELEHIQTRLTFMQKVRAVLNRFLTTKS